MIEYINVNIWVWIGLATCLIILLCSLWSLQPWCRTGRLSTLSDHDDSINPSASLPSLTVVVFTEGTEDEIDTCVERLRRQDYDPLQIVIVCRGTAETRELLVGRYAGIPNVYVTFVPADMHNVSERKMAITVGLKAAVGEIVLTTATNVHPASDQWLRQMAAQFADPDVEMVLGYSRMDFAEMHGPGRWYRQFDSVCTAGQWIGYALAQRPYRGDGYNLAFRKRTFFDHNGYANNFFLHYGDDDLFVSEVATSSNTRVCVSPKSIVTMEWGKSVGRVWTQTKARYRFSSRWLPNGPFLRAGFLSLLNWLMPTVSILTAFAAWPAYWPAIACGICWLTLQGIQIGLYRRMAKTLKAIRLWFALPLFMLLHPVLNFIFHLNTKNLRKVNYTWQR